MVAFIRRKRTMKLSNWSKLSHVLSVLAVIFVASSLIAHAAPGDDGQPHHRQVKVLVITMFEIPGPTPGEAQNWITKENLTDAVTVPGLSPNFPQILCTPFGEDGQGSDICLITTDQGYANAATSMTALLHSNLF